MNRQSAGTPSNLGMTFTYTARCAIRERERPGDRCGEDILSDATVQARPAATRFELWITWAGRAVSVIPVGILLASARWKLTHNPWYVAEWGRIGYAPGAINGIGVVQLACVALYVSPQTAILGTVLLTGYLGGAIAAYVRIGEPSPVLVPLSTCLLAWAGIYLRDPRLRARLSFRRAERH